MGIEKGVVVSIISLGGDEMVKGETGMKREDDPGPSPEDHRRKRG